MDSQTSVLVADENRLFREGLRQVLAEEKEIKIVGEAVNRQQAVHIVGELKPDVMLIDMSFSETESVEIIPSIKEKSPTTKPLILSVSSDEEKILEALKAGARGYLSKDAGVPDLIKAIQSVNRGELWLERQLMAKFIDRTILADSRGEDREAATIERLTQREKEVLGCLTKGCTNKEIAETLFISERTVKSHLNNIFRKIHVTRRLQAILYAIDNGFEQGVVHNKYQWRPKQQRA
jgi:DNA-binding NarL/FixJ family response regulator